MDLTANEAEAYLVHALLCHPMWHSVCRVIIGAICVHLGEAFKQILLITGYVNIENMYT